MIQLPEEVRRHIRAHARVAYPDECCGVLLGRVDGTDAADTPPPRAVTRVVRAIRSENARTEERNRRYLIPPDALRRIDADARAAGCEIVGFYHSHPDHAPEPSAFDREHAWPWYAYVIIGAAPDAVGPIRAWRLRDDRSGFAEEDLST